MRRVHIERWRRSIPPHLRNNIALMQGCRSALRGVHETQQICANCHKDLHEVLLKNTEHGAREGGKTQCVNCHADKAMKTAAHKTVTCIGCHDAELTVQLDSGKVYPLALKHNLTESWTSHNLVKDASARNVTSRATR